MVILKTSNHNNGGKQHHSDINLAQHNLSADEMELKIELVQYPALH